MLVEKAIDCWKTIYPFSIRFHLSVLLIMMRILHPLCDILAIITLSNYNLSVGVNLLSFTRHTCRFDLPLCCLRGLLRLNFIRGNMLNLNIKVYCYVNKSKGISPLLVLGKKKGELALPVARRKTSAYVLCVIPNS